MGRLLLVGNSRWHWAERTVSGLKVWHEPADRISAATLASVVQGLEAWACVGQLPEALPLPPQRRLGLDRVPLVDAPAWLGVDRALAGWWAWRQQGGAVLVADAGTCLSLTRVDSSGGFRGGRLSAGVALQLRALGQGTAQLPQGLAAPGGSHATADWPRPTAEAMQQGCLRACAAAVQQGWLDAQASVAGTDASWRLWLTGGDAPLLAPLLRQQGVEPVLAPDLALEGLAALA